MEITKFKMKGDWDEIQIIYKVPPNDTEKRTVNYVCKERPRNELIIAFEELMEHIRAIALLNWETGMIRSINFKWGEKGLLINVIAQDEGDYKVEVNIKPFYPTGELLKKIEGAIAHLEDYVKGKRAQTSLIELLPPKNALFGTGFAPLATAETVGL
jgi:hypothetical protein